MCISRDQSVSVVTILSNLRHVQRKIVYEYEHCIKLNNAVRIVVFLTK